MKKQDCFPGKYLKKEDCDGGLTLCIERLETEEVRTPDGRVSDHRHCYFQDCGKPLVLNQTNWCTIADMYGDDDDDWAGHWVELFNDRSVAFQGKKEGGIRIRPDKPNPELASAEAVEASADTELKY